MNLFQNLISTITGKGDTSNAYNNTIDTRNQDGFLSGWSDFTYENFQDTLSANYQQLAKHGLNDHTVKLLDDLIVNDPIISACYEKLLSLSDTDFELEIDDDSLSDEAKETIIIEISDRIAKLLPFTYTLRDFRRFVMSRIIAYGVFAGELFVNDPDNPQFITSLKVTPPDTVNWQLMDGEWRLCQVILGQVRVINRETYVYRALQLTQNQNGIYPVPLFKAALRPHKTYTLFQKALNQIAVRTGYFNTLALKLDATVESGVSKLVDKTTANSLDSLQQKKKGASIKEMLAGALEQIRHKIPNGFIGVPPGMDIQPIQISEPPANLAIFNDMLSDQVISGCKLYPALVGVQGRENQTTLSSNQKLLTKALAESIQACTDSVIVDIITKMLAIEGIEYKFEIESESPQLDGELEEEQAKAIKLQNEMTELQLENAKNEPETSEVELKIKRNEQELESE